jgi:CMP-N,N'-diacetyllegionaminic acid synthase
VIDGLRVLALITARGGSKGLPGKNIRPAGGKPLLAWTVEAARGSRYCDRVVISTDDETIAAAARAHGCEVPFMRPSQLATDTASSMDVVMHALQALPGFDLLLLLQPTSPLRTSADIDAACELLLAQQAPACVSITPARESPYWMYSVGPDHALKPVVELPAGITRRQDLPLAYSLNGGVYLARTPWLQESRSFVTPQTVALVMPANRSLDIDTLEDFEAFTRAMNKENHG